MVNDIPEIKLPSLAEFLALTMIAIHHTAFLWDGFLSFKLNLGIKKVKFYNFYASVRLNSKLRSLSRTWNPLATLTNPKVMKTFD